MATRFESIRDFMRRQGSVGDTEALWQLILDFFHARGIPLVSYHHLAPPLAPGPAVGIRADGFPEDWVCGYIEERLWRVDPIPEFALRSTRPFFWSEAMTLAGLLSEQRAYLDRLAASGIGDGLAVQVFGPAGRNGYFGLGFGGGRPDLSADDVAAFQMICQAAHLRYCDLVPETRVPALSQREREVLEWVARGKSNGAIAIILEVSTHTIDAYLRRIFTKMNVSDRRSAVIRGIGAGLLSGPL